MASISQLPVKAQRVKSIFDSDDDSEDEVDVCGQSKYEDLIKEKDQNGEGSLALKESSVSSTLEISKHDGNRDTTKIDKQPQHDSKSEPAKDNPEDIVFDSDSDSHPVKSSQKENLNSDSDSNFPIGKGNEEDTEEESDDTSADKSHETKQTSGSCLTSFSSYGFGERKKPSDEDVPGESRSSNPFGAVVRKDGKGNLQIAEDVQYSLSDFENDRMSTEENQINSSDSEYERLDDGQALSSGSESELPNVTDSENHDEAGNESSSSDSENQEAQNETRSLSGDSDNPDIGENDDSPDEVTDPAADTAEALDTGSPDAHLDSESGDEKERPVIDSHDTETPSSHLTVPTEASDQGHKSDQDDIPPTPGKLMDLTVKEDSSYGSSMTSTSKIKGTVSKILDFDPKPKEELKSSKEIVREVVKSPKEGELDKSTDKVTPLKKVECVVKDKLPNDSSMACVNKKSELDKDITKSGKESSQSEISTESKSQYPQDDTEAALDKQRLEKGKYYDKDILSTIGKGKYYDKDILSAVEKRKYYEKDIMNTTQKSKCIDEDVISDVGKGKYFDKDVINEGESETSVDNLNAKKVTEVKKIEMAEKEIAQGDDVKKQNDRGLKEEEKMVVDVCVEDKKCHDKGKTEMSEDKKDLEKPTVRKEIPSKAEIVEGFSKGTNKDLGKVLSEDKKDSKCEPTRGNEIAADVTNEDQEEQKLLKKKKKKRKIEAEFRRKTSDIVKVEDVFTETESDSETLSAHGGTDPDIGEQNQDSDALVIDLQPSTREGTPASPSVSAATTTSQTSTVSKGRLPKETRFDLENVMKAFYKGWRREVVHRATIDPTKTNSARADVYYYTPEGKKLRSKVEIEGYLQKNNVTDLTLKNFTWSRQPLGIEAAYEIIRVASKTPQVGPSKGAKPAKAEGTPKRITVPLAQNTETPAQLPLKRKRGRPKKLKDFETDATTPKRPRILVPKSLSSSMPVKSVVTVPSVTQPSSAIPVSGSFIQPIGTTIRTTMPIPGSLTSIPRIFHLPPSTQVSPVKGPVSLLPKKNLKGSITHMKAGNSTIIPLNPKKYTGSKVEAQKPSAKTVTKQPMVIANQIVMSSHQCPPMPTEMKIRVLTPMLSEEDAANSYHCTPNCVKGKGNIPSLQCVKCVCLFHPECFAMPPPTVHLIISGLAKFLCPNCFRESKENTPVNQQEMPARPQPFEPEAYDGSSDSESEDEGLGGDADFQNYNTVSLEPIRIVAPPASTTDGGITTPSLSSSQVTAVSSPSVPSAARLPVPQSPQVFAIPQPQGQPVVPSPNVGFNNAAAGGHMGGAPRVYIINNPNAYQQPHQKLSSYNQSAPDVSNIEMPVCGTSLPFPHSSVPQGVMPQGVIPHLVMPQGVIPPGIPLHGMMPQGMMPQQAQDGVREKKKTQPQPRQLFMELSDSYRLLLRIFSYFSVQDLLVVARVCVMWRDLAFNQRMWQKVRLRNCCVTDWKAMARFLSLRNTQEMDMRKMVLRIHRGQESGTSKSRRKDLRSSQEISTNGSINSSKSEGTRVKARERNSKEESSNSLTNRTEVEGDSDYEPMEVDKNVSKSQTHVDAVVKQEICEDDQFSSNNQSQDEEENVRKKKGHKNSEVNEEERMETEGIKMETDSQNESEEMEDQLDQWDEYWEDVAVALGSVSSLKALTLPNCSPKIVSKILSRCCKLKSFTALDIIEKEEATSRFDPSCLLDAPDVEELRIGSSQGLVFKTNFNFMKMPKLKTLVINDFMSSQDCPWPYLGTTLTTLELSSIDNFTKHNWSNIGSMTGLKKLRLVGGGCLQDAKIQGALMNLQNLHTLELLNFIISSRLATTLTKLTKLKNLCLLPSFTSKVSMPFQYGNMMAVVESVKGLDEFVWVMQVSDIVTINGEEGIYINRSKSEDCNNMDEEGTESCTLLNLMMLWKAAMPNSMKRLFKLEVMDRKVVNHFRVF